VYVPGLLVMSVTLMALIVILAHACSTMYDNSSVFRDQISKGFYFAEFPQAASIQRIKSQSSPDRYQRL
jgi:hypothetical protein